MPHDPADSGQKPPTSNTKRTASRQLLVWTVLLGLVALAILLLGLHDTGSTK